MGDAVNVILHVLAPHHLVRPGGYRERGLTDRDLRELIRRALSRCFHRQHGQSVHARTTDGIAQARSRGGRTPEGVARARTASRESAATMSQRGFAMGCCGSSELGPHKVGSTPHTVTQRGRAAHRGPGVGQARVADKEDGERDKEDEK